MGTEPLIFSSTYGAAEAQSHTTTVLGVLEESHMENGKEILLFACLGEEISFGTDAREVGTSRKGTYDGQVGVGLPHLGEDTFYGF